MPAFTFSLDVSSLDILIRMVISVIVGGAIGWERAARSKPAGLRTHVLVALGATVFTLIMLELLSALGASDSDVGEPDPLRIVSAIATGLGFLGAGCIIRDRGAVEGLTTATSIWITGALGVGIGIGHFVIAGGAFVLVMATQIGLRSFPPRFLGKRDDDDDDDDD